MRSPSPVPPRSRFVEDAVQGFRRYACAGISHADDDVAPAAREAASRCLVIRDVDARYVDRDPALSLDCVARVDGEIDDHALELRHARAYGAHMLLQRRLERDPRPERAAQQRQQVADDFRRVDRADLELLAPSERHELLDELRAALAGVARSLELLEDERPIAELFAHEIEIADEHGQEIVEVVRHTGRQAAERLHAGAVLRRGAQRLVVVAVDEDSNESPLCALAFRPHVTTQAFRRAVETSQIDLDPATGAGSVAPCGPRSGAPEMLAEELALAERALAKTQQTPHACVHRQNSAVGRNGNRRDHAARLENPEIDVGAPGGGILASFSLQHRSFPPWAEHGCVDRLTICVRGAID